MSDRLDLLAHKRVAIEAIREADDLLDDLSAYFDINELSSEMIDRFNAVQAALDRIGGQATPEDTGEIVSDAVSILESALVHSDWMRVMDAVEILGGDPKARLNHPSAGQQ